MCPVCYFTLPTVNTTLEEHYFSVELKIPGINRGCISNVYKQFFLHSTEGRVLSQASCSCFALTSLKNLIVKSLQ